MYSAIICWPEFWITTHSNKIAVSWIIALNCIWFILIIFFSVILTLHCNVFNTRIVKTVRMIDFAWLIIRFFFAFLQTSSSKQCIATESWVVKLLHWIVFDSFWETIFNMLDNAFRLKIGIQTCSSYRKRHLSNDILQWNCRQ